MAHAASALVALAVVLMLLLVAFAHRCLDAAENKTNLLNIRSAAATSHSVQMCQSSPPPPARCFSSSGARALEFLNVQNRKHRRRHLLVAMDYDKLAAAAPFAGVSLRPHQARAERDCAVQGPRSLPHTP